MDSSHKFAIAVASILGLLLVVILAVIFMCHRKIKITDTGSTDPDFIFEQSYYNSLKSIERKAYDALPVDKKLIVLERAKYINHDVVRKIQEIVANNIAKEAIKTARSTTKTIVEASTVSSINDVLAGTPITAVKDDLFKEHIAKIANSIIETSVDAIDESINKSLPDSDVKILLETRIKQNSYKLIDTMVSDITDESTKNALTSNLQTVSDSMMNKAISDLLTNFSTEIAKYKESIFSTASVMSFEISYPLMNGVKIIKIRPVVYIAKDSVIVDINSTVLNTISDIANELKKQSGPDKLSDSQIHDIIKDEEYKLTKLLNDRVKHPLSLAFMSANVSVNMI